MKPILLANDPLNLNDESGVLPTRLINIAFEESFFGKEDLELKGKLKARASGYSCAMSSSLSAGYSREAV